MIACLPLAVNLPSTENLGKFVISVLAVAGAAFLGGLLVGIVTQVLARMLTAKSVPAKPLNFLRLLGALAAGTLAAMVLFSTGGGGGWGLGGGGDGPGKDKGGEHANHDKSAKNGEKPPDKPPTKNGESPSKTQLLRIEVIVDPSQPEERTYRIEGEKDLLTLDEVEKVIDQRRKEKMDLDKVTIILYLNSPSDKLDVVKELVRRVERKGLKPVISLEASKAP